MNFLRTGHFFGRKNRTIHLGGIILTDTVIQAQENIDWHYHENAYLTLILQGNLIEVNQKKTYHCPAGSLLFHSPLEPHYNLKLEDNTKFFNVEFDNNCLDDFAFDINALHGSFAIDNPDIKFLLYKAFRETRILDDASPTSIQMLLFEILGQMPQFKSAGQNKKPPWTNKLKEILYDTYGEKISLTNLSNELNVHPVHLSRDFSKHFHCTFGEYVRKIRIEKSLALLPNKNLSLTEIAFQCGFADQSHFLRCFKQIVGINPNAYRKSLLC
jgi:AraC family transcriptional regulator